MHTAEFPTAGMALEFYERITGPGWYVQDVTIKGRKVAFEDALPADYDGGAGQHFADMLETVGYYGSTQNRKAKLDGVPAPIAY